MSVSRFILFSSRFLIIVIRLIIYALLRILIFVSVFKKLQKPLNFCKTFAREWLFTTNHKKLGLNYLLFASISGLFGTLLATLIRLELAQPNSLIFANKANAYHVVVGMHAIIMVFFLVTPIVFGGFGNYFLPIQVGARDVAYPRLNNFSLWILPAGLITALRTLWEGMKISNKSTYYEQNANNYSDWLKLNDEDDIYLIYSTDIIFDTYNYNLESKNWLNLIDNNTSNYYNFYNNCNNYNHIILNENSLLNFLPTLVVSSDLTNTMAGWTFTTPFSHSRFTGNPVDWAFAALLLSTISSVLTLINLIITWRYLRGRGSRYQKELFPIVLISIFISLRLLIIVSPILNAGLFMLMADRHFNTAFFTVRAGGDILLFQHIFWFFGHPEVYILIMPAFGIVSTLIPYYVRKPVGSKLHMIYAMHAISSMGFVVWGHHMYLVGIDNKARILFFIITVMIALPASVKVCGWVASLINSTTFISTELLFAILFIGFFIVGGITGSFCAHTGTDIMLHDTYYIIGHFHIMLSGSLMAMLFAYIYFNFREFFNVSYNKLFSIFHLIFHGIGQLLTFLPMLWLGYAGMPRRIQDYPWGYAGWHSVASFGHTIVLLGIFSFLLTNSLAFYLKRPVFSNNNGFPFITFRLCHIILNINYTKNTETQSIFFISEECDDCLDFQSNYQLA